ncbi:MAG: hypothetical protein SFT92_02395 [Rickettsiales bacterium]|nr:hypothetical protein [Rickettsiales bacterium]
MVDPNPLDEAQEEERMNRAIRRNTLARDMTQLLGVTVSRDPNNPDDLIIQRPTRQGDPQELITQLNRAAYSPNFATKADNGAIRIHPDQVPGFDNEQDTDRKQLRTNMHNIQPELYCAVGEAGLKNAWLTPDAQQTLLAAANQHGKFDVAAEAGKASINGQEFTVVMLGQKGDTTTTFSVAAFINKDGQIVRDHTGNPVFSRQEPIAHPVQGNQLLMEEGPKKTLAQNHLETAARGLTLTREKEILAAAGIGFDQGSVAELGPATVDGKNYTVALVGTKQSFDSADYTAAVLLNEHGVPKQDAAGHIQVIRLPEGVAHRYVVDHNRIALDDTIHLTGPDGKPQPSAQEKVILGVIDAYHHPNTPTIRLDPPNPLGVSDASSPASAAPTPGITPAPEPALELTAEQKRALDGSVSAITYVAKQHIKVDETVTADEHNAARWAALARYAQEHPTSTIGNRLLELSDRDLGQIVSDPQLAQMAVDLDNKRNTASNGKQNALEDMKTYAPPPIPEFEEYKRHARSSEVQQPVPTPAMEDHMTTAKAVERVRQEWEAHGVTLREMNPQERGGLSAKPGETHYMIEGGNAGQKYNFARDLQKTGAVTMLAGGGDKFMVTIDHMRNVDPAYKTPEQIAQEQRQQIQAALDEQRLTPAQRQQAANQRLDAALDKAPLSDPTRKFLKLLRDPNHKAEAQAALNALRADKTAMANPLMRELGRNIDLEHASVDQFRQAAEQYLSKLGEVKHGVQPTWDKEHAEQVLSGRLQQVMQDVVTALPPEKAVAMEREYGLAAQDPNNVALKQMSEQLAKQIEGYNWALTNISGSELSDYTKDMLTRAGIDPASVPLPNGRDELITRPDGRKEHPTAGEVANVRRQFFEAKLEESAEQLAAVRRAQESPDGRIAIAVRDMTRDGKSPTEILKSDTFHKLSDQYEHTRSMAAFVELARNNPTGPEMRTLQALSAKPENAAIKTNAMALAEQVDPKQLPKVALRETVADLKDQDHKITPLIDRKIPSVVTQAKGVMESITKLARAAHAGDKQRTDLIFNGLAQSNNPVAKSLAGIYAQSGGNIDRFEQQAAAYLNNMAAQHGNNPQLDTSFTAVSAYVDLYHQNTDRLAVLTSNVINFSKREGLDAGDAVIKALEADSNPIAKDIVAIAKDTTLSPEQVTQKVTALLEQQAQKALGDTAAAQNLLNFTKKVDSLVYPAPNDANAQQRTVQSDPLQPPKPEAAQEVSRDQLVAFLRSQGVNDPKVGNAPIARAGVTGGQDAGHSAAQSVGGGGRTQGQEPAGRTSSF